MRATFLGCFLLFLLFTPAVPSATIHPAIRKSSITSRSKPLTFLEPARGTKTELILGSGKAVLHNPEDFEVFVTGADRDGKPWSVHPGCLSALGFQAITGDLDGDGQNDLVLISLTGANGSLPGNIVGIISFEPTGKPLLFSTWTTGNFTEGKPLDLADLDGDGRYEFLKRELRSDGGRDKFDAFSITTAYSIREGRWRRLQKLGRWRFPLFGRYGTKTAFNYLPPNNPPRDGRVIPLADRSNDAPVAVGKLFIENGRLLFHRNPEAPALEIKEPPFPACYDSNLVFVDDARQGRTIRSLPLKSLIQEMGQGKELKNRATVLFGQCRPNEFSPGCIWLR